MRAPDDDRELEEDMASDGIGELGQHPEGENVLPEDSEERKDIPMVSGLLDYFPAALAAVARVSKVGNDKHNPGEPLHHARGKSMDHADTIVRHLVDRGRKDAQGVRHSAYAAWRALAQLQQELEDAGEAPLARGAVVEEPAPKPEETVDTLVDLYFGRERRSFRVIGRRPIKRGDIVRSESVDGKLDTAWRAAFDTNSVRDILEAV